MEEWGFFKELNFSEKSQHKAYLNSEIFKLERLATWNQRDAEASFRFKSIMKPIVWWFPASQSSKLTFKLNWPKEQQFGARKPIVDSFSASLRAIRKNCRNLVSKRMNWEPQSIWLRGWLTVHLTERHPGSRSFWPNLTDWETQSNIAVSQSFSIWSQSPTGEFQSFNLNFIDSGTIRKTSLTANSSMAWFIIRNRKNLPKEELHMNSNSGTNRGRSKGRNRFRLQLATTAALRFTQFLAWRIFKDELNRSI